MQKEGETIKIEKQQQRKWACVSPQVIKTDANHYRRLILEGIEIRFNDNLVNLQAGFIIDECWMPFRNKLYRDKQDGSG